MLRFFCIISVVSVLLFLPACDDTEESTSPPIPVIVSLTDSSVVDAEIQLVAYLPQYSEKKYRYTLIIDWGDGRPFSEHNGIEPIWHFISKHSYFDPGQYEIRCRSRDDNTGRISSWTSPHLLIVSGSTVIGKGDWWMFMHDNKHSGQSNYTGPATPTLLYKKNYYQSIRSSAVFDNSGTMYFGGDGQHLNAIYQDFREKWSYNTGGAPIYSTPLLLENGTIYFGSNSANVYGINRLGLKTWSTSVYSPIGYSSPAPLPNGNVVIGCTDGRVYTFTSEGNAVWSVKTHGPVHASPAVDDDGIVYVGSEDQLLYAIDPSGNILWTYKTTSPITGSASITPDGAIIFGNAGGYLYSLHKDGRLRWQRNLHHPIRSTPAASNDGRIVCALMNGDLVSLLSDGSEQWRTSFGVAAAFLSPVLDIPGNAYIGAADGSITGIDRNGGVRWRYQTDAAITCTPSIGQRGQLVFANESGWLFVLGE